MKSLPFEPGKRSSVARGLGGDAPPAAPPVLLSPVVLQVPRAASREGKRNSSRPGSREAKVRNGAVNIGFMHMLHVWKNLWNIYEYF